MKRKCCTRSQMRRNRKNLYKASNNLLAAGAICMIAFTLTCLGPAFPWWIVFAGGLFCATGAAGRLFLDMTRSVKFSEYCY